jgi:hypothetical protein
MFTVVDRDDVRDRICECASFTNAHRIAIALHLVSGVCRRHFSVLRSDGEKMFDTLAGIVKYGGEI